MEKIQEVSGVHLGCKATLEEIKTEHIRRVLESSKTLKEASQILGIDPATLYRIRARRT